MTAVNSSTGQTALESPQAYYSTQSAETDPGRWRYLYAGLPTSLEELCRVDHGLMIHLSAGHLYNYSIPEEEMAESDIREVSAILARIAERDPQPLVVARPPARRFVGHCRVTSVLFCSMLRERGIPVVARAGFWGYHSEGPTRPSYDHWITEVWKESEGRWVLVDPEQDEEWMAYLADINIQLNPLDIERHRFITSGQAWLACRQGGANPEHFGLDPSDAGMRYIRGQLLRDIACFNKCEVASIDIWGLGLPQDDELSEADLGLLDHVAELDARGMEAYEEIRRIYAAEPRLRPEG